MDQKVGLVTMMDDTDPTFFGEVKKENAAENLPDRPLDNLPVVVGEANKSTFSEDPNFDNKHLGVSKGILKDDVGVVGLLT